MMANERSTHVGCAVSRFHKFKLSGSTKKEGSDNEPEVISYLVACNYSSRNMPNKPVYRDCNTPAQKCQMKHVFYKNLCSLSERYKQNKF